MSNERWNYTSESLGLRRTSALRASYHAVRPPRQETEKEAPRKNGSLARNQTAAIAQPRWDLHDANGANRSDSVRAESGRARRTALSYCGRGTKRRKEGTEAQAKPQGPPVPNQNPKNPKLETKPKPKPKPKPTPGTNGNEPGEQPTTRERQNQKPEQGKP